MAEPNQSPKDEGNPTAEQAAPLCSSPVSLITSGGSRIRKSATSVIRAHLSLYRETLECRDAQPEAAGSGTTRSFLLEDLVGIDIRASPPAHDKNACQMNVHVYPKRVEKKKTTRRMTILSLCFEAKETFAENREEASKWKKEIKLSSYCRLRQVFCSDDETEDTDAGSLTEFPRRHLLVFINPVAGSGRGIRDFQEHVRPLFELAEIDFNVIVTERQNHARDLLKDYDLSGIDGIVIASGDGLLYEVVNGVMERDDWEQALKTPIGMLPTGSGNALCASTLYEAGEEYSLVNATFQIIQGGVIPMDITTVETADKQTLYMTLLGGWGMVADIDIESEKLRKIGDTRFVFGALNCIRKKRIYRGRLVYLPYDESEEVTTAVSQSVPTEPTIPRHSSDGTTRDGGNHVTASLNPELLARAMGKEERGLSRVSTASEDPTPLLVSSDENGERERSGTQDVFGDGDVVLEETSIGPIMTGAARKMREEGCDMEVKMKKELTETEEQDWESVKGEKTSEKDAKSTETAPIHISSSSPITVNQPTPLTPRSFMSSGPRPHLLPDITEAVPDNWKVIEGEFLSITPLMIPHMSSNFFGDPKMSIGTGKIRILYMRKMSRFGMLGVLTDAEKGNLLDRPEISSIDAKAFRLEPYTEEGILTVDGEVVKYGPIQAQIHQHLARVFCSKST